jgi:glycosyltransferase involved in cell wall biosynthesis
MKKVLLITYYFPPAAQVGATRPAKFAKYLPTFGWQPIVLTVKQKYHGEPQSSPEDPGTQAGVIRTMLLRNPSYYYRKFKRLIGTTKGVSGEAARSKKTTRRFDHLRGLIDTLLTFPDEYTGWLPFAITSGLKQTRRDTIDILWTSGPPHSVHLVGAFLRIITQIAWVADFRDPYLDDVLAERPGGEDELFKRLSRRVEAWLISRASLIITTTSQLTARLKTRYPEHEEKIITLTNGYDPDDFGNIAREKTRCFTISYIGSFYGHRDPEPILRAISELVAEKVVNPARLRIQFVGDCDTAGGTPLHSLVTKYDLDRKVELFGWVPRAQALRIMVQSHLLVLLAEQQPLSIPGKVYDYLGAGSDILAVTGEGATADLLRDLNATVVSPGDVVMIKQHIAKLYTNYVRGAPDDKEVAGIPRSFTEKYSRRYLAGRLAELLDACQDLNRGSTNV